MSKMNGNKVKGNKQKKGGRGKKRYMQSLMKIRINTEKLWHARAENMCRFFF